MRKKRTATDKYKRSTKKDIDTNPYFFSDRTLKTIAIFMMALAVTLAVPHVSLWGTSFGTKAAEAQSQGSTCTVNGQVACAQEETSHSLFACESVGGTSLTWNRIDVFASSDSCRSACQENFASSCSTPPAGGITTTITFQETNPAPPQLNTLLTLVFNVQDNPNIASINLLVRSPNGQTFQVPIQWRTFGCPPSCSGTFTPNQVGTYQYDIRALSSTGGVVAGPISGTFSVDTAGTSAGGPYLCVTGNSYFCSASSSCNGLGIFHSNRGSVQACSSECSRLASSGAVCTTEQAIRQQQGSTQYYWCDTRADPNYGKCFTSSQQCLGGNARGPLSLQQCQQLAGTSGSTGISSNLACQACQERGGVFCAIQNDYINSYAYGTSGINPLLAGSLYRTECVRDANECSLKRGTSYENGATCPDLCQETCYTASLTGGFQIGAGSVQGSNFQSLGLPIASCSPQPPIDIAGIILTGTSNQNVLQRPLLLQGNLCPAQQDRCWCTIIRSSSISGSIGGTSGLGFSSIPGSTRTQHWAPPKFTPPKAGPNEPVCDLASKNITIQAGLEGADGSSIRLVLAGQPVTIKGDIGTRSGVCKGYSYTCLDFQESQCEFKKGFWKDTYKYQACEVRSDFDNLGRIAGKGSGSDWHIGKIIGFIATALAVVFTACVPCLKAFAGLVNLPVNSILPILHGMQALAPTIDGCGFNSLALLPLAQSLGGRGISSDPQIQCELACENGRKNCVNSCGREGTPGYDTCERTCFNNYAQCTVQRCSIEIGGTGDVVAKAAAELQPEEIERLNRVEQRITGRQIPGCSQNDAECKKILQSLFAGAGALQGCPQKEPRECWSVCGFEYKTEVGAQPLCDQGGVVCDYNKNSKSCTQSSATAGTYQCTSRSCGGAPDATVNIRVIAPDGSLIKQDQTRADANGLFSYTLNAPDVDGEVTLIVSTPQQGSVTLSIGG